MAANSGCKFCLSITNQGQHERIAGQNKSDAELFLGALPSWGRFGVLSRSDKLTVKNAVGRFYVTDWVETEILALPGKFWHCPLKHILV